MPFLFTIYCLIIPSILFAQLDFPVFTTHQTALGGSGTTGTHGTSVFHNPAGMMSSQISGGLGKFYGDSGVQNGYICTTLNRGNWGAGAGVHAFWSKGHSIVGSVLAVMLHLPNIRAGFQGGLITQRSDQIINERLFTGAGIQFDLGEQLMIGALFQTRLFYGSPVFFKSIAVKIHISGITEFNVQYNHEPPYPSILIFGGEISVLEKLRVLFGIETAGWSASLGIQFHYKQLKIGVSVTGHPYLGARSITGFNYVPKSEK
ncbi:hypothetical protein [Fulvivirga sedimenti]|uniref:Uncharacterized protein n=1 Tax=Fulvivirga sedimenti TaxID=2879465 RepID=A0A9X1HP51_9BACT|nr:hypothetical protein [Fulvivirga sedimenti]MCA6075411.1 hypothetical protein [Fulvivirga sedimenti]MCA6076588.1 hypothetical protein [Fulvivirga sedimenti]MCA6077716.1 hypothetical protein [Fulvivirga sedimenti]